MSTPENEILFEQRGLLGVITLNRPRAINALTHTMVGLITDALERWRDDETVATVAIIGSGERGLCAGGDVVSLYEAATSGQHADAASFWADEYRMNAQIANYPKPIVALQDGLVLGGGIGVSAHASHRVVTERSKLGFPEVTIGFVPDVGASWLLGRAPGGAGIRLGLTAEHVGAADAIYVGFSDVLVPSDRLSELLGALEAEEPDAALARLGRDPGKSALAVDADGVDAAFRADSVPAVIKGLRAAGADGLAEIIEAKSPTALAVTFESLRRAAAFASVEEALETEFIVSMNALTAPDFAEGIRAQLIDKDRNPRWTPQTLDDVDPVTVEAFFNPGPAGRITLDRPDASEEPP